MHCTSVPCVICSSDNWHDIGSNIKITFLRGSWISRLWSHRGQNIKITNLTNINILVWCKSWENINYFNNSRFSTTTSHNVSNKMITTCDFRCDPSNVKHILSIYHQHWSIIVSCSGCFVYLVMWSILHMFSNSGGVAPIPKAIMFSQ